MHVDVHTRIAIANLTEKEFVLTVDRQRSSMMVKLCKTRALKDQELSRKMDRLSIQKRLKEVDRELQQLAEWHALMPGAVINPSKDFFSRMKLKSGKFATEYVKKNTRYHELIALEEELKENLKESEK